MGCVPEDLAQAWNARWTTPLPPLQHTEEEYGENVDSEGRHSGGPFLLEVSPAMRIEDLRKLIKVGGLGDGLVLGSA